ncbi:MAG TPA: hypothetical protein VGD40_02835 [Chryseosolibacter sp.]
MKRTPHQKASSGFSLKAVFQYLFIVIASLVFASTQFSVLAKIHSTNLSLTTDAEVHLIDQHTKTSLSAYHHQADSHPSLPDTEVPGETEVEEEQVDEGNDICEALSTSKAGGASHLFQRHVQFKRSLQNRPGVSLIILYHSWKSFLV